MCLLLVVYLSCVVLGMRCIEGGYVERIFGHVRYAMLYYYFESWRKGLETLRLWVCCGW